MVGWKRAAVAAMGFVLVATLGALSVADQAPPPLRVVTLAGIGPTLTAPNGMTLYTYANDTEPERSLCTGTCAENWPPFRPAENAPVPPRPLSVMKRLDGSLQYTYKGKPLYFCKTDQKPGEAKGHKFRDFWFAAQP